jgi:hypothetical protein
MCTVLLSALINFISCLLCSLIIYVTVLFIAKDVVAMSYCTVLSSELHIAVGDKRGGGF